MPRRIIDLSVQLEPTTPVYPDYQPFEFSILETTEDAPLPERRRLNSSRIAMGLHCGTHMDAPFHFIAGAPTIDRVALEQCCGPALLVRLSAKNVAVIEATHLEPHGERLRQLKKVILDTGWRRHWGDPRYFSEHPLISGAAAKFLVQCGVHLVGVDMPSVDQPPFEAHLVFLGNGVVIVENLTNLEQIQAETFELIALPLKLNSREASPVRAIAMEID